MFTKSLGFKTWLIVTATTRQPFLVVPNIIVGYVIIPVS